MTARGPEPKRRLSEKIMDLSGKVIAITGGGQGLGLSMALFLSHMIGSISSLVLGCTVCKKALSTRSVRSMANSKIHWLNGVAA